MAQFVESSNQDDYSEPSSLDHYCSISRQRHICHDGNPISQTVLKSHEIEAAVVLFPDHNFAEEPCRRRYFRRHQPNEIGSLEDMESLSTFWSRNRDQPSTYLLAQDLHDFKMEWKWNEMEERSQNLLNQFYLPSGVRNTPGNHALLDYQMQLMLLEQQNKKRLMMARQQIAHLPASQLSSWGSDGNRQVGYQRRNGAVGYQHPLVPMKEANVREGGTDMGNVIPPSLLPRAMRHSVPQPKSKSSSHILTTQGDPKGFPQFSRLSPELRVKVWTYASQTPRIVELYICTQGRDIVTSPAKPPAVLEVCRESRYEALKYYHPSFTLPPSPSSPLSTPSSHPRKLHPPKIYYNPHIDTIYVGEATYHHDLSNFLTSLPSSEVSKIQALALPLRLAEGAKLLCVDQLPGLRELIYVVPSPHQYCVLLRHWELWFEDARSIPPQPPSPLSPSHPTSSPNKNSYAAAVSPTLPPSPPRRKKKKPTPDQICKEKGWVADRTRRRQFSEKGPVFAEIFWMALVGEKGVIRGLDREEEAWMPPGSCEYCRAHREGRALALKEEASSAC